MVKCVGERGAGPGRSIHACRMRHSSFLEKPSAKGVEGPRFLKGLFRWSVWDLGVGGLFGFSQVTKKVKPLHEIKARKI